jgi:hypothetical protein
MDVSAEPVTTNHKVATTDHMSPKSKIADDSHHLRHHGLALLPPPSEDPRDPLRWPQWMKVTALLVSALTNFTANFAGAGLSVAVPILEAQYRRSAHDINALLTVCPPSSPTKFNLTALKLTNCCPVVQFSPPRRR